LGVKHEGTFYIYHRVAEGLSLRLKGQNREGSATGIVLIRFVLWVGQGLLSLSLILGRETQSYPFGFSQVETTCVTIEMEG
jgi:hypothetical protein